MLKNWKYLRYLMCLGEMDCQASCWDDSVGKGIDAKPEDLNLSLEPTWWKESMNF